MFARVAAGALLLAGGACAPSSEIRSEPAEVQQGPELLAACAGKQGEWTAPAPPAKIHGSTYYVGTCGLSAILVATNAGLVLIDGTVPQAAASVMQNIERLGFRPEGIHYLFNSHEHFDHAGGLAAIQARSQARAVAVSAGAAVLAAGRNGSNDPQLGLLDSFPPIRIDRVVSNGDTIQFGEYLFTPIATPGHSPGSTTWTWRSCEAAECMTIVYADSVTAISNDTYRFSDHPSYVAEFRESLDKIASLDCDVLLTPHPGASRMFERMADQALLADSNACRAYAENGRRMLDERLAKEKAR